MGSDTPATDVTKQFSIIGGGTMGTTFGSALLANEIVSTPEAITICEIDVARRERVREQLGVKVTDSPKEATEGAPVVFFAVKPQDFPAVGKSLQGLILPEQLVVSIMAGVPIQTLRDQLGHRAVVRAMPNTPAQVGQGMTVWTAAAEVDAGQRDLVRRMLATLGVEVYVPDERHLDMATAVSGSGPGFFYLVLEAMIDGAVQIGVGRELATQMVYQTALGSAAFAQDSGLDLTTLRAMVTSPGGTTAAGIRAMESGAVRSGMIEAIIAAYERARELGQLE